MRLMREVEIIKKTQIKLPKVKSIVAKMKNSLDGINNKLNTKENKISGIYDMTIETIQNETKKKD